MIPFINSKKIPRVMMVMGRVRTINKGLTIKLSKLKTIATITAVTYESTATPGNTLDSNTTAKALYKSRKMKFITTNKKSTA